MSMGFAFVSVLLVYFGELAVILYYGVFARVYITELGLLRGNFQCPLGQQFTVVIYVCTFTCACGFTLPSVWGVLLSFLFFLRVCRASCSVWSSLLFLSPHCAVMWYSWVGPFVCGFFQVFSGAHCDLHPIACWQVCCQFFLSQLLHHLGIQWQSQWLHQEHRIHFQTRSRSWWPMHFNILYWFSSQRFVQTTMRLWFPVQLLFLLLFSVLFPTQQWLLPAHLPPLQVRWDYLHLCLCSPPLSPSTALAWTALLNWSLLQLWYHMLPASFWQRQFGLTVRQGTCSGPRSCALSCETGEQLLAPTLWS